MFVGMFFLRGNRRVMAVLHKNCVSHKFYFCHTYSSGIIFSPLRFTWFHFCPKVLYSRIESRCAAPICCVLLFPCLTHVWDAGFRDAMTSQDLLRVSEMLCAFQRCWCCAHFTTLSTNDDIIWCLYWGGGGVRGVGWEGGLPFSYNFQHILDATLFTFSSEKLHEFKFFRHIGTKTKKQHFDRWKFKHIQKSCK